MILVFNTFLVDTAVQVDCQTASQEKEQQLHKELATLKRISKGKDLQISHLEGELQANQVKTSPLSEQQQRELEMQEQESKWR